MKRKGLYMVRVLDEGEKTAFLSVAWRYCYLLIAPSRREYGPRFI
jgi:hypothetical protein